MSYQKITWDGAGKRYLETGTDHGIVFLQDAEGKYPKGIAWNGLTSRRALKVPKLRTSGRITLSMHLFALQKRLAAPLPRILIRTSLKLAWASIL